MAFFVILYDYQRAVVVHRNGYTACIDGAAVKLLSFGSISEAGLFY